jgi:hypothetical protein
LITSEFEMRFYVLNGFRPLSIGGAIKLAHAPTLRINQQRQWGPIRQLSCAPTGLK